MLLSRIQALVALLNEYEALLENYSENPTDITNFVELKENVFIDELRAALLFIREAVKHPKTFRQAFTEHSREREKRNPNCIQSFTSAPDSFSNILYWQVCVIIFQPKNLREMLNLILPDIQYYLAIEFDDAFPKGLTPTEIKAYQKRLTPILSIRPISSLDTPLSTPSQLLDFTFTHNTLFYVGRCRGMYYESLVQFYNSIHTLNPKLCTQLFDHNPTFNDALLDLKIPTLKIAIEQLILKFRNSGKKSTNATYATPLSNHAFELFLRYWALFTDEAKLTLGKLKGNANKTLDDIIEHLKNGECVEEASDWLQSILDAPQTQKMLLTLPSSSNVRKTPYKFEVARHMDNQQFPPETFKHYLSTIIIKNSDSFISLLIQFPPTLYADLLGNAKIKFKLLENDYFIRKIFENMFSLTQEQALAEAIALHNNKFGGTINVMQFALKTKNYSFITIAANLFNKSSLIGLLAGDIDDSVTALQQIINYPQAVTAFFKIYPSTKIYHETTLRNFFNKNCYDYCAHPASLKLILSQSPTEQNKYYNVLYAINNGNAFLLNRYVSHEDFITSLKESFQSQHYFWALLIQANIRYFYYHSIKRSTFQSIGLFFRPYPPYLQELSTYVEALLKTEDIFIFQNQIIVFLMQNKGEDASKFGTSVLKSLCYAEKVENSLEALKASWAIDEAFLEVVGGYF